MLCFLVSHERVTKERQNEKNCESTIKGRGLFYKIYHCSKEVAYFSLFFILSEWQDEPTVVLIEFIKSHPSIWDSSDLMYRNVRMNKNLFLDLVQLLGTKYPEHGYTYGKSSNVFYRYFPVEFIVKILICRNCSS